MRAFDVATDGLPVDRDDHVPGPQAGHRGRARVAHPAALTPWICTWLSLGTPTKVNRANRSTKAIRKCMAEPATATSRRARKGLLTVDAGLVGRVHLLEVGHPRDLHVARRAGGP